MEELFHSHFPGLLENFFIMASFLNDLCLLLLRAVVFESDLSKYQRARGLQNVVDVSPTNFMP